MIPKNSNEIPFQNLAQFVGLITSLSPGTWIYRGEANAHWTLRPKAGRDEFYRDLDHLEAMRHPRQNDDLRHFRRWRNEAIAYDRFLPTHELECLAYAQHYGLATRLLDWSRNPLVALFFATETHDAEPAVVYCYYVGGAPPLAPTDDFEKAIGIRFYTPRPFDRRIAVQQGVFTYHSHPRQPFEVRRESKAFTLIEGKLVETPDVKPFSDLNAITIPAILKHGVRRGLRDIGITRNTLFPDLEGLSRFINWEAHEELLSLRLAMELRTDETRHQTPPAPHDR